MTVAESLRKRAGFLLAGGASFALVLGVTRAIGGQPLLQPQSDIGVLIGLACVAGYFVFQDTRGNADGNKTGLN